MNWKYDSQFNQVQDEKGRTIIMSWGKTATKQDKVACSLAPEMLEVLKYINECTKGKEILNHGNGDEMQITIDFEFVKNIGSLLSRAPQ